VKKQPEVTEQTRVKLKQAFRELYLRNDLAEIHVKDITDQAGYNRATFYQYFRDIPELFSQVQDDIIDNLKVLINDHLAVISDGSLESDMGFLLNTLQNDREILSVLLSERGDPRFVRRFKDIILPLIDQGISVLHLGSDQALLLREFYLSGTVAAVSLWLSQMKEMSIEAFARFATNSFGLTGATQESCE
jgi:AcrR family transcriptional regulator